jgi:hypothetical protein
MDGLIAKKFARKIPRPPQGDSNDWDTNLYELLWHEVFDAEPGGDKLPLRPGGKSTLRGGEKSSQPGGDKLPHKKNHHHQDHWQKCPSQKCGNPELKKKPGQSSQRESVPLAKTPNPNQESANPFVFSL